MSVKIEDVKKRFLETNELLYDKEFLSEEENEKLSEEYLSGDSDAKDKILEVYNFDYDEKNFEYHFYKQIPISLTDKEMDQYIMINVLNNIRSMNDKLDAIKFVIVLWFILTIIGILLLILGL
jgi:hypothetical protein